MDAIMDINFGGLRKIYDYIIYIYIYNIIYNDIFKRILDNVT